VEDNVYVHLLVQSKLHIYNIGGGGKQQIKLTAVSKLSQATEDE
jgi:hypothetical protein